MIIEWGALALTILTGGAIQSQLANKYLIARRLANIVAIIAATYLIKDIWHDVAHLTQSADAPNALAPNPEVSLEDNIKASWSWKGATLLFIVCLFSAFLAMLRGVTREFLDFGSWVLAALATLYVYRADWFNNTLSSNFSSLFFSLWIVFLFFLVIFLLVASILERGLDSSVGPIDKAFGFSYGLVRGFLLVGVGAGVISYIWGPETIYGKPGESLPIPLNIVKSIDNGIKQYLPSPR